MKPRIEYWFDFSCPFAYLGSVGIEDLAKRTGAELQLKPMLLGGVFRARAVPQNLAASVGEAKARHNLNDMRRYATHWKVPFEMPNGHPLRTVNALRAMLASGEPFNKLMHAFFRAYWVEGLDISSDDQIKNVLSRSGYDADAVMKEVQTERIKQELFQRTDEAIAKGIFGAPGLVVDGSLYWGQDRIQMVERILTGCSETLNLAAPLKYESDFYFDYASPFSFLAIKRMKSWFKDSFRYRPVFLGGLWKTANPRALQIDPNSVKRAYTGADFRRQAKEQGVEHEWPSVFPVKSTLALRVTLLSQNNPELINRIFDAYWKNGQDIAQASVIQGICEELDLDGEYLVRAAGKDEAKKDLRDATQLAMDAGVFGAPTMVVHVARENPALYWGNDRLWMAALAARGEESVI